MAESVLTTIAGEIVKKAGSGVLQEIGLFFGVKDELEKLKSTVTTIKAVLLDAEEQYWENNHQVRRWLDSLREVLYAADDWIDDFSTMALQRQAMSGNKAMTEVILFFSQSNQIVYGLKMAHKIKDLRVRLEAISAKRRDLNLVERPTEKPVILGRREWTDFSLPKIVIGREIDMDKIAVFLLSGEENLSIVSIVGLGGIGKTTLAQLVYNNETVRKHFERIGWVYVSNIFDVKLIGKKLLESLTGERQSNCEMDRLKNLLHERLSEKKFLIILDDVWNENPEEWSRLRNLLVGGATGSKIVITTRSRKVAEIAESSLIHELPSLTANESWFLFARIAFKEGQAPNPTYESIGREIVHKCGSLPLALITIGGLLYYKHSVAEWESFRENELSKVKQDDILGTLSRLRYIHLPSHLKHCFAYCSLFPKDYVFDVENLIHLWMAHGYIELLDSSQCFEEKGYEHFMDLLSSSFFQGVEGDELGNIKSCKMNNLMRDLAISAAGHGSNRTNSNSIHGVDGRTYHMSLSSHFSSTYQISDSLFRAEALRTFLLPNQEVWLMEEQQSWKMQKLRAIFSKFRRLRVFDLHNCGVEKVPPSIDMLKHLRYLDVSDNDQLKALPNSVTKLINLEVLKLSNCEELKELPEDMRKLVSLRHLYLDRCWSLRHMPWGLGQLTSLQTLTWFVIADHSSVFKRVGSLKELGTLNNLRGTIEIRNLKHVKNGLSEFEAANLRQKKHLESLSLCWNRDDDDVVHADHDEKSLQSLEPHENLKKLKVCDYEGVRFPSWLSSLKNLVDLCLQDCGKCELLPQLHHIQSLKYLRIHGFSNMKYIDHGGYCNEGGLPGESSFFSSLEELYLVDCPNLEGWWKKRGDLAPSYFPHFDSLHTLEIRHCPLLTNLPLFPNLNGMLTLENASFEPLQQTLRMEIQSSSSSSMLIQCSSSSSMLRVHHFALKALWIVGMEDLDPLPQELLGKLTSLQELHLLDCPQLASLPIEMRRLVKLRELDIANCCKLKESCGNGNCPDWQKISHIPNIRINGQKIQWDGRYLLDHKNVASPLSKSRSMIVKGPEYLPEDWLQNFTCLEELRVVDCPKLISLSRGMRHLTSLQQLEISQCPYLKEACGNSKCLDWPNISHIRNIQIDGQKIQWQGHYLLNE